MSKVCVAYSDWYLACLFFEHVIPIPIPSKKQEFLKMFDSMSNMFSVLPPFVPTTYLSMMRMKAEAAPIHPGSFLIENPSTFEEKEWNAVRRSELLTIENNYEAFKSYWLDPINAIIKSSNLSDNDIEYFGKSPVLKRLSLMIQ